jgi:hypothetical protein
VFAGWAGLAAAASLQFDTVPGEPAPISGTVGRALTLDGARLSTPRPSRVFVYRTGDFGIPTGGGFCALASGFTCKGRATLRFDTPVSGLMFDAFFAGRGDRARVTAFAGNVRLGSVLVRRDGLVDLSRFEGVTRITFRDRSTREGTGIAWGNFRHDDPVTPVPLPPAGVMMAATMLLVAGGAARLRLRQPRPETRPHGRPHSRPHGRPDSRTAAWS